MALRSFNYECPVCLEHFTTDANPIDRRPMVICANGHSICSVCLSRIDKACPECRQPLLPTRTVNGALIGAMRQKLSALKESQTINFSELKIGSHSIGRGSYADVFEARWHEQKVAVKIIRYLEDDERAQVAEQFHLEASIAMNLHHKNIVRTFGLFEDSETGALGLALEFADRGSLDKLVWVENGLTDEQRVTIALQTVDGLAYLHSKNVIHRDFKPANILLFGAGPDNQLGAKIADFGISRCLQSTMTRNTAPAGTPKYAAPELLESGRRYTTSADIFSLSMTLFELFTQQRIEAQLGTTVVQMIAARLKGKQPTFNNTSSITVKALKAVIEHGWAHDSRKRASLNDFREALNRLSLNMRSKQADRTSVVSDTTVSQQKTKVADKKISPNSTQCTQVSLRISKISALGQQVHMWQICEFPTIAGSFAPAQWIASDYFHLRDFESTAEWLLRLYPNGHDEKNRGHLSISLVCVTTHAVVAKYKFEIVDECGNKILSQSEEHWQEFAAPRDSRGLMRFCTVDFASKAAEMSSDKSLFLICEVDATPSRAKTAPAKVATLPAWQNSIIGTKSSLVHPSYASSAKFLHLTEPDRHLQFDWELRNFVPDIIKNLLAGKSVESSRFTCDALRGKIDFYLKLQANGEPEHDGRWLCLYLCRERKMKEPTAALNEICINATFSTIGDRDEIVYCFSIGPDTNEESGVCFFSTPESRSKCVRRCGSLKLRCDLAIRPFAVRNEPIKISA